MTTSTIGDFLLRRLGEAGIRHAFGVPGDYKGLSAPNDTLIFIEAVMDPYDAPLGVINAGNNGADLDYGPRGPQHRDNLLIRPAT